jgi:hypothetical protein
LRLDGEQGGWNASHAAGQRLRIGLIAPRRVTGGSVAVIVASSSTNEPGGSLNRTQYPSDIVALIVFWRLRYKLSLRDLPEMFLLPQRSRRLTQVCSFELTQRLQSYRGDHCRLLSRVDAASVVVPVRSV